MRWPELKSNVKQLLNGRNLASPRIRLNALENLEAVIRSRFPNIYNDPILLLEIGKGQFIEMISKYKKLNGAERSIINNFYQILGATPPYKRSAEEASISKEKSHTENRLPVAKKKEKPLMVESANELNNPDYGLKPLVDEDTRCIILGTFPAKESIKAGFYYQNPTNKFWGQALKAIGKFDKLSNGERNKLLLKNKIGLWDIFECVERSKGDKGKASNQDSAIEKAVYNDIAALLRKYKNIKYLIFNGGNAEEWLPKDKSLIFSTNDIKTMRMQSTSGSNGHFNEARDWMEFFGGEFLEGNK